MTLDERKSPPDLTAALNQLWTRFLPEMYERVAMLETAAQACVAGEITSGQREAARAAAHKLAGTLGTFGLAQGSELAREFEQLCSPQESCSSSQAQRLAVIAAEIRTIVDAKR
jgi:HPt (histidine-containing phosphotransfer) domain-containing protein